MPIKDKGCERVIGFLAGMGENLYMQRRGESESRGAQRYLEAVLVFIRCGACWLLLSNAFSLTYRPYGLSVAAFADDATARHETVTN